MIHFFQIKTFKLTLFCWLVILPGLVVRAQTPSKPNYKMSATHPLAKIGSELAELQISHKAGTNAILKPGPGKLTKKSLLQIQGDYVVIEAVAEPNQTAQLLADLKALGMTHAASYGRMVSGLMPIGKLDKVAALPNLHFARPGYKPINRIGEVTSQGDVAMYADSVRKYQVLKGKGNKIGVLSDSYNSRAGAEKGVKSGDIPGKGNPNGYTTPVQVLEDYINFSNIDEGRAMIELIHDVAPAAELAFHTAFLGQANFAQGILDLQKAGCNIITDDVYYPFEPMFQDGIIAQAVDEVAKKNVAYFSAAGNSARQSYQAKFKNSGKNIVVNGVNYGVAHDFGKGDITQTIRIPKGGLLSAPLQWDDPFYSVSGLPGAETDLDVLVFYKGELLTYLSSLDKNGGNDPVEYLGIVTDTTESVDLDISIVKYSGPDPQYIKWINFGDAEPLEHDTKSSTIVGHSNAAGAVSTGAVFWGDTPAYGTPKLVAESFSSAGGTPILIDADGKRIKEVVRQKPEIMAPDGGNTTFFYQLFQGKYYFFGTSAAAPHAAAVAALMQESAGHNLSREKILQTMQETAIDMEEPGFDFDTGYGFLNAFEAVNAVAKPGTRSFALINASNGQEIQMINEGTVVNLTRLSTEKVRFRAMTGPMQVGSVVLELNGKKITENKAPYDYPNSSDSFELKAGDYTLTATPYTKANGEGEVGIPYTIHFKVLEEQIVRFELVNVANGKVIQTLESGNILYLPDLPDKLNIRAITSPAEVGSVQFNLNGIIKVENKQPYEMAGSSGDGIDFSAAVYVLSATTYPSDMAKGKAGDTKTIFFGAASVLADVASITDKLKKQSEGLTVFPNPVAQKAKIQFQAAEASNASLTIYNLNGSPVATLFSGNVEAGKQYELEWDARNLPGGLYISRLVTKSGVIHRTIQLQK
ncbi:S8 family serine peptidase [Adhaeribacter radiodurans]|uniref:S8 family serine peptidase n=1 Tax=Adhaeribacter radiodurans TaxID=2745197 RepID=A0A7L7L5K0_9BACT|nr:S8 family serine peptidase [Adhaeribacter radiodurans]QMU28092.1 S8 family serine peptidase [Adhaeribacter radiodurans]